MNGVKINEKNPDKSKLGIRFKKWFCGLTLLRKVLSIILLSGSFIAAIYAWQKIGQDALKILTSIQSNANVVIHISALLLFPLLLLVLILAVTTLLKSQLWLRILLVIAATFACLDVTIMMSTIYVIKGDVSSQLIIAFFHETTNPKEPFPAAYKTARKALDDAFSDTNPKKPILKYIPVDRQGIGYNIPSKKILNPFAIITNAERPDEIAKKAQQFYKATSPVVLSILPDLESYFGNNSRLGLCANSLDDQFDKLLSYAKKEDGGPLLVVYSSNNEQMHRAMRCKEIAENKRLATVLLGLPPNQPLQKSEIYGIARKCGSIIFLVSWDEITSFCDMLLHKEEQYEGVLLLTSRYVCDKIKLVKNQNNFRMVAAVPSYFLTQEVRQFENLITDHSITPTETAAYLAASLYAHAIKNGANNNNSILHEEVFKLHAKTEWLKRLGLDSLDFSSSHIAILHTSLYEVR